MEKAKVFAGITRATGGVIAFLRTCVFKSLQIGLTNSMSRLNTSINVSILHHR